MVSEGTKEGQLRYSLIEKAPLPIFVAKGSDLRIEYANRAALSLLDRKFDIVTGKPLGEVVPEVFSAVDIGSITERCLVGGESLSLKGKQLGLLQFPQAPVAWLDVDCEPLRNDSQKVVGVVCYLKDVTSERILLTSLDSRSEYLINFFKVAPIGIVCYRGPSFIVDFANDQALAMWGKTLDDVRGKAIEEIFPEVKTDPVIQQRHLESVERMKRGERHIVNEVELVFQHDGMPHTGWYSYIHEPYTDSSGKIVGMMAIASEVTDQVIARNKLQLITDSLPSLISYVNTREEYTFVNKSYEAWFGVDRSAIIGKTLVEVVGNVAYANLSVHIKKALSGQRDQYEGWVDYKTKGRKYISAHFIPHINESQNVVGFVGVVTDLTERKAQEEALKVTDELSRLNRVLAEAQRVSKLGSWEWDMSTGQITWSDEMYSVYGYKEKFPVDYTRATERMTTEASVESRKRTEAHVKKALEIFAGNGSRTYDITPTEFRIKLPDGIEKILRNSGKIYLSPAGKLEKIFGTVQDVTQIRSTEQQLQEAIEMLEEKNSELETFSYVASHDLKEPLRKIITFADRLKQGNLNTTDDYVSKIEAAALRMMDLIESILTVSQVSNSSIELGNVDLNSVLENCKSDLEVRIRETGAIITNNSLGVVKANRSQMSQLFSNLVGNSLKFCSETPRIEIGLDHISASEAKHEPPLRDGQYWRLTFSDNGIGFDPIYKEQVFEPFKRLHGKNAYGGAGIGLSIVKKIVERHKGYIDVESAPGRGTKFSIFLPM